MNEHNDIVSVQEFEQVHSIISLRRSRALQTVNNENLLTAWEIGAYVSDRLKNSAWGSKTVMQLSEYLRSQDPTLRGYSKRNIYNMVSFYETYSSPQFIEYQKKLKLDEFVQPLAAQIGSNEIVQIQSAQLQNAEIEKYAQIGSNEIVQIQSGQIGSNEIVQAVPAQLQNNEIVQFQTAQIGNNEIVQFQTAQFPNFLYLITLSNHFEIINSCKTIEEQIFYVLYAHKERLNYREIQRCLKNHTFASLMGDKHNFSTGMKQAYPQALSALKDTIFVDFLGLPKKHSEKRLQTGILSNLKDFILELGKDFLFYDQEMSLKVGGSTFKVDLVFFHRGLRCLVAIELKNGKFKPEYMGQLEFYLEALDRDVRRSDENPSIGILLCQEADRSIVEYAMSRSLSPTMIAEYNRLLIPKEALQRSLEEFTAFLNPKK
ncbi:MAG: PDDEXK nuclease domain-containing protein [Prevotellaceae bacterium]|jgi:predicted nuclease of restriction endonuclease-like (RecB) superfamily|nr:PDDEXK nuclease domain-containing protein [Prevotellaceae bacterium]